MPEELARLAAAQGGVVTRAQALASGLSPAQVRTRLRSGPWLTVERGIYAPSPVAVDDVVACHALLVAARRLALGVEHAASHASAALLLGLPLLGSAPSAPVLTRAPRSATDTSTSRSLHVARLAPDETWSWRGVVVTDPARTVCDLARASLRRGLVAADAALRNGLAREALLTAATRCAGKPGARRAAFVARFADGHAETPIESITRLAYALEGLPAPVPQVDVFDGGRWLARVDFAWEAQRTVAEADGLGKYRAGGDEKHPLVLEKLREERLRQCGLEVVRNTWADAWSGRGALAARVREHFAFAQRYPPVHTLRFRQAPLPDPPVEWSEHLRPSASTRCRSA